MSTAVAVHKALYQRLSGTLAVPVLDYVPATQAMPYVVIGTHAPTPDDALDELQTQHLVSLTVYSAYAGQKEVLETLDAIKAALHRHTLALEVGAAVACRVIRMDTMPEGRDEAADGVAEGSEGVFVGSAIIEIITED